jgi:hypothetical protein
MFLCYSRPEMFQELLSQVFSWNWKVVASDMKINLEILSLVMNIITVNATFLSSAFKLLVKNFIPDALPNSNDPNHSSSSSPSRSELLKYIHYTIQRLLSQVPTGIAELSKILEEFFPHKRFSLLIQTEYISSLLETASYLPVLQYRILDIVLVKCLEIDVEIVIDDNGEVRLQKNYDLTSTTNSSGKDRLDVDVPALEDGKDVPFC